MFEEKCNENEVYPNTLQYDVSTETLAELFNMQMFQYQMTGNVDFDVVMLGTAFDFIEFSKEALEIDLEFEEKSICDFEEVLDNLHQKVQEDGMEQEMFDQFARSATAYLGIIILKYIGGNWVDTNQGIAIRKEGKDAFVYRQMAKRIVDGKQYDVAKYYQKLKES